MTDRTQAAMRIGRELRELAGLTRRFDILLASSLAVNVTAVRAMEHLMVEGPLTPSELGARLELTAAAGSQVVDRLEAAGHVHRVRQDADRRRVLIIPAQDSVGRARVELAPIIAGVTELVQTLNDEQVGTVERFLDDLARLYQKTIESAGSTAKN